MRSIIGAGIHQCWLGTYEAEKQRAIAKLVRPGMTLYDVGAHSGFYTLLFSRLTGTRGMVYSLDRVLRMLASCCGTSNWTS